MELWLHPTENSLWHGLPLASSHSFSMVFSIGSLGCCIAFVPEPRLLCRCRSSRFGRKIMRRGICPCLPTQSCSLGCLHPNFYYCCLWILGLLWLPAGPTRIIKNLDVTLFFRCFRLLLGDVNHFLLSHFILQIPLLFLVHLLSSGLLRLVIASECDVLLCCYSGWDGGRVGRMSPCFYCCELNLKF